MVSKFPTALAAWDLPARARRSVVAASHGVAALFMTVAKFPAALAAWDVVALTRGSMLAAHRFAAAVKLWLHN